RTLLSNPSLSRSSCTFIFLIGKYLRRSSLLSVPTGVYCLSSTMPFITDVATIPPVQQALCSWLFRSAPLLQWHLMVSSTIQRPYFRCYQALSGGVLAGPGSNPTPGIPWNHKACRKEQPMAEHEFDQIFPLGEPNNAFAQYFIGQSYLAPLTDGTVPVSNVTFEPGCRNNWHIHHGTNG